MTDHRLRPTALEIAAGTMLGDDPEEPGLPPDGAAGEPLRALRGAVLPALRRPPCLVTFSGGRDSSGVLAVAVDTARREGLPLPIPITARFSEAPGSSEPDWQEIVIRYLGVDDWLRVDVGDRLDLVGPVAARVLRRHGAVWPVNACLFELLLEHARGGSLVTGVGGDSLLGGWPYAQAAGALAGRARPGLRDLVVAGYAIMPEAARRVVGRRRAPRLAWLRPEAQRLVARAVGDALARTPTTWGDHLAAQLRRRSLAGARWTLSLLAEDADAAIAHPLCDPGFAAALTRTGGRRGLGGRTAVMRALLAGLLPDELLSRSGKARFHYVYFRGPSRDFARRWQGEGVDHELVDAEALRAVWLGLLPVGASALALQAAWLASAAGEAQQPLAELR